MAVVKPRVSWLWSNRAPVSLQGWQKFERASCKEHEEALALAAARALVTEKTAPPRSTPEPEPPGDDGANGSKGAAARERGVVEGAPALHGDTNEARAPRAPAA